MTERLQKKVDRAIRLLQSIPTEDEPMEETPEQFVKRYFGIK